MKLAIPLFGMMQDVRLSKWPFSGWLLHHIIEVWVLTLMTPALTEAMECLTQAAQVECVLRNPFGCMGLWLNHGAVRMGSVNVYPCIYIIIYMMYTVNVYMYMHKYIFKHLFSEWLLHQLALFPDLWIQWEMAAYWQTCPISSCFHTRESNHLDRSEMTRYSPKSMRKYHSHPPILKMLMLWLPPSFHPGLILDLLNWRLGGLKN